MAAAAAHRITFAIIKPHAVQNPIALQHIRNIILDNGFTIVHDKRVHMNASLAEKFYEEHRTKFFYNRLATFMCRYERKRQR